MPITHCKHFTGYKPCGLNEVCDSLCPSLKPVHQRILLIHLGALGAVVRSTALLKAIHEKHPHCHLTWVTQNPAQQLLVYNNLIDRVLTTESKDLLKLKALEFDIAYIVDKSLEASGVLSYTKARQVLGFIVDSVTGAVQAATPAARELWNIGLNNDLKFYKNKKSELQLTQEALELPTLKQNEGYHLPLTEGEKEVSLERKWQWSNQGHKKILGINTGCSEVLAAKKLSVEGHRELIKKLLPFKDIQIVLLGGPEDRERNRSIAANFPIISSETNLGLRDGLVSVAACDVVFTGDSLGMHMSLSQRIYTLAWFGPSCAHEIDFFGHGEAILTTAECSPCWNRSCQKATMCYDLVDLDDVFRRLIRRLSCQIPQPNLQNPLDHF